ncbi:hypothetical protein J6Y73_03165 [bacterium]|nr:hypothetical protein [bacterium]
MDFNKILPENFFNLFQSKNRSLYIESLIQIYKKYETGSILGMPKDEARDIVEELLEENGNSISEFYEDEDQDEEIPNYRELANHFLRRFEKTGWVTIDVTNDYLEILNFNDYSISIILAFIEIKKDASFSLFADNFSLDSEEENFKGYVFTIYSLLNSNTFDYGLLLNQVYKNTINFVREIRKVDHKLREFIQLIDSKDNIKELVELLSQYKDEVMDKAYFKLKTFDNINKYKLDIIRKLEAMQENPDIMAIIANDYLFISGNDASLAQFTANKQINDCVDIYNSLDSIMNEIDKKNRDYITQTLAKVKYLLNDATDVVGILNLVVQHYTEKVKKGQADSGFNDIKKLFTLNVDKMLGLQSLSVPRGNYKKNENNSLSKTRIDFSHFRDTFFEAFKALYTEDDIKGVLEDTLSIGEEKDARAFIKNDASQKDIIRLLYVIIYASGFNDYQIRDLDEYFETDKYIIKNFIIKRRNV